MATFVHVTSAKHIRGIRNAGIKAQRTYRQDAPKGVYALPVVPNHLRTHQWAREIKRGGQQRIMYAVYFRIPDDTTVWVGRYNEPHRQITAVQAAALLMDENTPLGFEVIIPRGIPQAEITRIGYLSKLSGWRITPARMVKRRVRAHSACHAAHSMRGASASGMASAGVRRSGVRRIKVVGIWI